MLDSLQNSESSIGDIKKLRDQELLKVTADLVQRERHVLTLVLHHLREVERRRLFSDLGHPSLFEYCVRELKYSEGQAGRRIQAMRLLKELPEIEPMIRSGSLSLTNLSQAQSYFRDVQKQATQRQDHLKKAGENQGDPRQTEEGISSKDVKDSGQPLSRASKLEILQSLENTSSREGQRRLIEMENTHCRLGAGPALPKDRERPLGQDYSQVCFSMSPELKERLETARSLLGIAGAQMSLNDLLLEITQIAVLELEAKKFGKRRTLKRHKGLEGLQGKDSAPTPGEAATSRCRCEKKHEYSEVPNSQDSAHQGAELQPKELPLSGLKRPLAPAPERDLESTPGLGLIKLADSLLELGPTQPEAQSQTEVLIKVNQAAKLGGLVSEPSIHPIRAKSANPRYIPRAIRKEVWDRDGGQCVCCSSRRNLNFDYIQPVALGGNSTEDNLRLLCLHCNQRQAIKTFGIHSGARR